MMLVSSGRCPSEHERTADGTKTQPSPLRFVEGLSTWVRHEIPASKATNRPDSSRLRRSSNRWRWEQLNCCRTRNSLLGPPCQHDALALGGRCTRRRHHTQLVLKLTPSHALFVEASSDRSHEVVLDEPHPFDPVPWFLTPDAR